MMKFSLQFSQSGILNNNQQMAMMLQSSLPLTHSAKMSKLPKMRPQDPFYKRV